MFNRSQQQLSQELCHLHTDHLRMDINALGWFLTLLLEKALLSAAMDRHTGS
jgi:hypothetical protein